MRARNRASPNSTYLRRLLLTVSIISLGLGTTDRLHAAAESGVTGKTPSSLPASFAPERKPHKARTTRLEDETVRRRSGGARPVLGRGRIRWEALDTGLLAKEDRDRRHQPGAPTRVGINRPTPGGPVTTRRGGVWKNDPDGGMRWSVQLELPGAEAVRVHFSVLDLHPGTRLLVAGAEGSPPDIYTDKGPRGNGDFWAAPTPGEVVYLEYSDPTGLARAPVFKIDQVSHLYRGAGGASARREVNEEATGSTAAALLPCHEDVNCWPVDEAARDSVGRMVFTIPGEGTFLCTGALLNDVDTNTSAGYFLTANHCIDSQAAADTLVVYWFFQSNSCGGVVPSMYSLPRSTGATLLATSPTSDFSLSRLDDDPSDGQGFAAWTSVDPSGTVRGIHHPDGSYKRYSAGPVTTAQPICGGLPLSRYIYNDWDVGIIEGGSSGSPLFNGDWEVVGQLFGVCYVAEPDCDNSWAYNNVYGRLSYSFSSIVPFLSAVTPDDAYEDNDTVAEAAPIDMGTYELRLVDFDDYFAVTLDTTSQLTATATFSPNDMDLDLMLLDSRGVSIVSSIGSSGTENVSASVSSGTYLLRAVKTHGWGGDYTLDVEAVQTGCDRPEAPTLEPDAVVATKNRFLSFIPGNAERTTALRVILRSLHHPNPQNAVGYPAPDLSWLEGTAMWVGPPLEFVNKELPPVTFHGARLTCEPHYRDWGQVPVVHVYGPEVVPSSTYDIQVIEVGCDPDVPDDFSHPLTVATGRWGDVVEPFQGPLPASLVQPDIGDIIAILDALQLIPGHMPKTVTKLRPAALDPSIRVDVLDLAAAIDALQGEAYPYTDLSGCP